MERIVTVSRVRQNALWIIAGKVFHALLSFLISLLTARYLGPSDYGTINYAAAYTTFFSALCTLGINSVIVKDFTDHPGQEGETIGTSIVLRAISSFISAVTIVSFVSIVDAGEKITIIVVALSSIGLLFQVFDTINYWFQSRLQSKYSAIATSVSYAVVTVYKVVLLVRGMDIRWFAIATSVDYIVAAAILLLIYKRCGGGKFSFSWEKGKELLAKSSSFIICGLMVSIYNCTDRLMLKQMLGESAVSYYAVAVVLCSLGGFLFTAIIDSMYPPIMQMHNKDKDQYERLNRQLYAIVFYLAVFMSVVITIGAKLIVRVLYGTAYLPAVVPLRIVTWYSAFSYLGGARNAWVVCENRQKYLTYLYVGAAVTNVLLNTLLIPHFGASGAAAASLITQITTIFVFPCFIRELRPNVKLMIEAVLLKSITTNK